MRSDIEALAQLSKADQDKYELTWMLNTVASINPELIVEIGVNRGGFLNTCHAIWPDAVTIGIDIDFSNVEAPGAFFSVQGDSREESTRDLLLKCMGSVASRRDIDFLFIDGDHSYKAVKRDYLMYAQLVRKGGIVGFHDTNPDPHGYEVNQLMRVLDEKLSFPTMDLRGSRMSPGTRLIWI